MHTTSLKVEKKLKFVGECPVHCLAPAGAAGLYLCTSRSNHRRLSAAAPAALSPLSSPKLPFTLLNYLQHSVYSWWLLVNLHHLSPSCQSGDLSSGHNCGSVCNVLALQRGMSHVSAEATLQQTLPSRISSLSTSSRVLFLPCAPLPHSCRLQLLIVTNKEAEQHQMNPERST